MKKFFVLMFAVISLGAFSQEWHPEEFIPAKGLDGYSFSYKRTVQFDLTAECQEPEHPDGWEGPGQHVEFFYGSCIDIIEAEVRERRTPTGHLIGYWVKPAYDPLACMPTIGDSWGEYCVVYSEAQDHYRTYELIIEEPTRTTRGRSMRFRK